MFQGALIVLMSIEPSRVRKTISNIFRTDSTYFKFLQY